MTLEKLQYGNYIIPLAFCSGVVTPYTTTQAYLEQQWLKTEEDENK